MDDKTLKKLEKLSVMFDGEGDYLKVDLFIETLKRFSQNIKSDIDNNSKYTEKVDFEMKSLVNEIYSDLKSIKKDYSLKIEDKDAIITEKINSVQSKVLAITKQINTLLEKVDEITALEIKDGKDADEEKIKSEIFTKLLKAIEENKEVLTGEDIVDRINLLEDSEENKIDAKYIKNLPNINKGGVGITSVRMASDVRADNPQNGQVLVWDSALQNFILANTTSTDEKVKVDASGTAGYLFDKLSAGSNVSLAKVGDTVQITALNDTTATWGSISGSLSAQTDLQNALNAKQATFPNFTSGQILFGAGNNVPITDSGLFWDNLNKRFGIGTSLPTQSFQLASGILLVGSTSAAGNYVAVLGSNSDNTYDVFRGERKYPRFTLKDTIAGGSEFNFWNLGNQMRFGTVTGNSGLASLVVGAGAPGYVQMTGNASVGHDGIVSGARFYVKGLGTSSSTQSFAVHNSTGTSNTIIALDNGNIGLGVSSPLSRLHLDGNLLVQNGLIEVTSNFDKKLRFTRVGFNSVSLEQDASRIYFYNETTGKLLLAMTTGGNLGVGTYTPSAKLEVVGIGTSSSTNSLSVHNSTGSSSSLVVRDDGNVGIGVNSPITKLHILDNEATANGLIMDRVGSGGSYNKYRRANGTVAVKTTVTSTQVLGKYSFEGYNGSNYNIDGVIIQAVAEETFTGTAGGTKLEFYTTPNGTVSPTLRIALTNSGILSFSESTNISTGTTTGTKIGTSTNQKIGFWNATPVVQPSAISNTTGAILGALEMEVNKIKDALRSVGIIAT